MALPAVCSCPWKTRKGSPPTTRVISPSMPPPRRRFSSWRPPTRRGSICSGRSTSLRAGTSRRCGREPSRPPKLPAAGLPWSPAIAPSCCWRHAAWIARRAKRSPPSCVPAVDCSSPPRPRSSLPSSPRSSAGTRRASCPPTRGRRRSPSPTRGIRSSARSAALPPTSAPSGSIAPGGWTRTVGKCRRASTTGRRRWWSAAKAKVGWWSSPPIWIGAGTTFLFIRPSCRSWPRRSVMWRWRP